MPGDERHEQLQHDRLDRSERDAAIALHQQRDQRRCDDDAEQIGEGRAAHRRRDIAARDRGEGDRGLYGRGQQGQEQHPRRRRTAEKRQRAEPEAEQRKQDERHAQHSKVQPPVAHARDDRGARQFRAVQEEQQHDAGIGGEGEDPRPRAPRGQERRQQHGAEQDQDEGLEDREDTTDHDAGLSASGCAPSSKRTESGASTGSARTELVCAGSLLEKCWRRTLQLTASCSPRWRGPAWAPVIAGDQGSTDRWH
jgi:hypothetical protein